MSPQSNPLNPRNWGTTITNSLLAIITFFLVQIATENASMGERQNAILQELARFGVQVHTNEKDIEEHTQDIKALWRHKPAKE